ncbi:MAG: S8 family serine peptidase, partial [archaeon]
MRTALIGLIIFSILFFSGFAFSVSIENMTPQEKKGYYSLVPVQNKSMSSLAIASSPSSDELVSFLVESSGSGSVEQFLGGVGWANKLLGGKLYSVTTTKSNAVNLILSDSVSGFSINHAIPFLEYSVPSTNASTFYNNSLTGSTSSVCIIDTGIRTTHFAFSGKTIENLDCNIYGSADFDGHGTHVAGIATGNAFGLISHGVSYGTTHLINGKGFTENPDVDCLLDNLQNCFALDRNYPADVANSSWGTPNENCGGFAVSDGNSGESRYVDALAVFYKKVLVFAAGNSGPGGSDYACLDDGNSLAIPSDTYNVIAVASMDTNSSVTRADDSISSFSSRGPTFDGRKKPDIAAPGNPIASAYFLSNSSSATMG